MIFAIQYLRPDGWWEAGRGWDDRDDAARDVEDQLPESVQWRIVEVEADEAPAEGAK